MDLACRIRELKEKSVTLYLGLVIGILGFPAVILQLMGIEYFFTGHDSFFHMIRFLALDTYISQGCYYPPWLFQAGDYGIFALDFYPSVAYYIAEMYKLIGLSYPDALTATFMLTIPLSVVSSYLLFSELYGTRSGLVGAAAFLFVPYRLVDLFVRSALPELLVFSIMPILFFFSLKMNESKTHGILFAITYSLSVLTHPGITLMISPFLVLFILLVHKNYLPFRFLILGVVISSFYWLTAVLEGNPVSAFSQIVDYTDHFVYLEQFFERTWGYGTSFSGPNDGMSFQLGWFHILSVIFAGLISIKKRSKFEVFFFLSFITSVFMMLGVSEPLWHILPFVEIIQYPWRFLVVTSFATAGLAAFSYSRIEDNLDYKNTLLVIAILLFAVYSISLIDWDRGKGKMFNDQELPGYDKENISEDFQTAEDGTPPDILGDFTFVNETEFKEGLRKYCGGSLSGNTTKY